MGGKADVLLLGHAHGSKWSFARKNMEKAHLQAQGESTWSSRGRPNSGSRGMTPPSRGSGAGTPPETLAPAFVPHLTEKYDPDHPDADWGGFVQRTYKKRAFFDPAATRNNLVYDERGGIIPNSLQATTSTFSGKKIFDSNQIPGGDESVPGIPFQSAVYQVGPGDNNSRDWKSAYASQTSMEPTSKEMYALGTRQNSQTRRHITPMYEQHQQGSTPRSQLPLGTSPWDSNPAGLATFSGSSSSGGMTGHRVDSRRSLLAGIGKLVASEDLGDDLIRPQLHISKGFSNPTAKVLLAENHHTTPGYTGRRNL